MESDVENARIRAHARDSLRSDDADIKKFFLRRIFLFWLTQSKPAEKEREKEKSCAQKEKENARLCLENKVGRETKVKKQRDRDRVIFADKISKSNRDEKIRTQKLS